MRLSFLLFLSILFTSKIHAQSIPEGGYHAPLGIPLVLSANFGELRPNHFHMGLDFKTNGSIGYNLYSIADGFVSRIKVSPYGYGKVIYIDHPNGTTSVYAHCSEFKGKVDSLVRLTQEREQNYEVELHLTPEDIPLKKGEIFALSGNTGSSTAPHLHFEIRDTKTEAALNPLVFGFDISDSIAPEINSINIYGLTKEGYRFPGKKSNHSVSKGVIGKLEAGNNIIVPAHFCSQSGGIGIAVSVVDRLSGSWSPCGLYGSILIVNGDTIFGQQTDRIPFESTRYVNCHKDHGDYSNGKKFHKCFKTTLNNLPIYTHGENGILPCKPGDSLNILYIAYDPKGNRSELNFDLLISAGEMNPADGVGQDSTYLQPTHSRQLANDKRSIDFPAETVYEPLKLNPSKLNTEIGTAAEPVHNAYQIKIKSEVPSTGKQYIEVITAKGSRKAIMATYDDGWYSAESKFFGTYALRSDTLAPTIAPLNFKATTTYTSKTLLTWKVADTHTSIKDYDLFIDGKWYLLEYETKGSYLSFNRPVDLLGAKELKIIVKDEAGNAKEWVKVLEFR